MGVAVVLIVLLLAWGINTLHNTLPATSATVTIKPMSQEMRKTYTIGVNAQVSSPMTVKGRELSANSEQLVQSAPATGQGHHDAVSATGTMVVSQINLTNSTGNDVLNLSIADNNGVTATGDESVHIYTGGTVSIPSHATPAGSAGNIAAHDMDGPIQIIDHYTQAVIGTAYISNPQPFSGGVDARDYTYVQQSDIDKVANALVSQLTAGTKAKVKQQVKSGELLVQDPSCSPKISPDHQPQDEAASVTVKVSLTCSALTYRTQQLQDAAVQAYEQDGITHFGKGYSVVGTTVLSKPVFVSGSSGSFSIAVNGIWTFKYTDQSQLELKKLIAGKPSSDALQMLRTRKDIQNVTLTTEGGFGSAVPSALPQIKLIIGKVNGLSA
jgi:VCBS repeat-containing protein